MTSLFLSRSSMAKLQFIDLSVVLLLLTLQLAGSAWILEVQLHNFSNPRKARYDPQLGKYCCCDCPINCKNDLNLLLCNACILESRRSCEPSFLFCLYYNESNYQCVQSKIYFTDYTTILQFSSQSNLFPTLKIIENDKKPDENLLLNVSVKEHDQHQTQFTDYINISLPFKQSSSFSSPTSYNGVYGVCSMTLAYRFTCGKNYFGDNCDVYCSDDKEKEGNFACDSTGNKICYGFENGTCSDSHHSNCSVFALTSTTKTSTISVTATSYIINMTTSTFLTTSTLTDKVTDTIFLTDTITSTDIYVVTATNTVTSTEVKHSTSTNIITKTSIKVAISTFTIKHTDTVTSTAVINRTSVVIATRTIGDHGSATSLLMQPTNQRLSGSVSPNVVKSCSQSWKAPTGLLVIIVLLFVTVLVLVIGICCYRKAKKNKNNTFSGTNDTEVLQNPNYVDNTIINRTNTSNSTRLDNSLYATRSQQPLTVSNDYDLDDKSTSTYSALVRPSSTTKAPPLLPGNMPEHTLPSPTLAASSPEPQKLQYATLMFHQS